MEPQRFYKRSMNSQEQLLHINTKELLAAWFAIQCYTSTERDIHIYLKIDNMTSLSTKWGPNHLSNRTGNGACNATSPYQQNIFLAPCRHGVKSQSGLLRVVTEYNSFSVIDEEKGTKGITMIIRGTFLAMILARQRKGGKVYPSMVGKGHPLQLFLGLLSN